MNDILIAAGILLVLVILAGMWRLTFKSEVTSAEPLDLAPYHADAILSQIAGTPLGLMLSQYHTEAYPRFRSRTMRAILISAGSLDREALVQAAIPLCTSREIAEAYADEIISLADPGEELPAALAHAPNLGGLDSDVPYAGPNYVEGEELVDEMRGVIRWSHPDGTEFDPSYYRKD